MIFILLNLSYFSLYAAAAAKSLQLCLTLCDPRDGSPPRSPIPGTVQARTLEWVAIAFSDNELLSTPNASRNQCEKSK